MIGYAVHYYQDMVRPNKIYRLPDSDEAGHLAALATALAGLDGDDSAEAIQSVVYATGKAADYENLRDWFKCLYEVLLGQAEGWPTPIARCESRDLARPRHAGALASSRGGAPRRGHNIALQYRAASGGGARQR